MTSRTLLALVLVMLVGGNNSWAKRFKQQAPPPSSQSTIIEISPMSLTVDLGKDVQQTYKIAANTKVTLNGTPVTIDDIKAGMVTTVQLAADNETAISLDAQKAPRVIKKGRKLGTTNLIWW